MKTSLLSIFALVIGISVSAQNVAKVSPEKANLKAKAYKMPAVAEPAPSNAPYIPGDGPKSAPGVTEAIIGTSMYDLQSNANIQNRIYAYPDGTVGAVWTMGLTGNPGFTDRGTGYNYFDGTNWGEAPTARLETSRCGWPSYAPLGAGEMVITHAASNLNFCSRPVKGTGTWTTTAIPNTAGFTWPRAITSNGKIHVIANTNAVVAGLNFAVEYMSSSDNGATWTTPVILPGMDAATLLNGWVGFDGIGGDDYSWAAPQGDTIAFVFGDILGGVWAMKSFDNGATWMRTTIYEFPNFNGNTASPDVPTFDETYSIALDNEGKVHFVGARYKMTGIDATASPLSWYFYPYTDGLVYWNENMPQMDTSYLNNPDTLINHGMWIGSMVDINGNGQIDYPDMASGEYPWGAYRYAASTTMPQIAIDKDNNIFVSFSCLREDLVNTGANPHTQMYHHLYLTSKMASEGVWTDQRDLFDDIEHSFDECVWGSMAIGGGNLHFVVQVDPEPGTAVVTAAQGGDEDPYGDNYMTYISFPTFVSTKPVDIAKDVMVSPNPANEYANVMVQLEKASKVEVNVFDVMGKLVMSENHGIQNTGYHTYKMNTSSLTNGMYLFTVKIGNSQTSKKVIVNN
jgi:hypothetical protein